MILLPKFFPQSDNWKKKDFFSYTMFNNIFVGITHGIDLSYHRPLLTSKSKSMMAAVYFFTRTTETIIFWMYVTVLTKLWNICPLLWVKISYRNGRENETKVCVWMLSLYLSYLISCFLRISYMIFIMLLV